MQQALKAAHAAQMDYDYLHLQLQDQEANTEQMQQQVNAFLFNLGRSQHIASLQQCSKFAVRGTHADPKAVLLPGFSLRCFLAHHSLQSRCH